MLAFLFFLFLVWVSAGLFSVVDFFAFLLLCRQDFSWLQCSHFACAIFWNNLVLMPFNGSHTTAHNLKFGQTPPPLAVLAPF